VNSPNATQALGMAQGLAARVGPLRGWRGATTGIAAGALSVLAMAPFHAWPVLCLTLPILIWRIDGAGPTDDPLTRTTLFRAFLAGWSFGFGYFVAGLFWIGEAFLVEAEIFAWLIPFAVTLLPAGLALFWGAAAAMARAFWQPHVARVVVLAVALSIFEWLRGHVLTGFPWNLLGYALTSPLEMMQAAAYIGVNGLTLVAAALLPLPAVAAAAFGTSTKRFRFWAAIAVAPLAAIYAFGYARLSSPATEAAGRTVVRIVQPSIRQRDKWRPENQRRIFETHLAMSRQNGAGTDSGLDGIALVVWPEAAMPFVPLATPEALAAIGALLPPGTTLASGALRVDDGPSPAGAGRRRVYNSLLMLGASGAPVAIYDKTHLVPFGEYLPAQSFLEAIGLQQLVRMRGGFTPGREPRGLVEVAGLPAMAPLICYEAIFPSRVVQSSARPGALLNITNDGWFGNTTGPRQHLVQARVRAVEEGLPLIRAANNGISAVVDPFGRITARIEMDVVGTVDAVLPAALPATPFARFGDLLPGAMLAATILALLLARVR